VSTVVHIEKKTLELGRAVAIVHRALQKDRRLNVTGADAAALTGLPLAHAEQALLELCSGYPARLRVLSGGVLIFEFKSLDKPRDGGPLVRLWQRARDRVVQLFGPALAFFTVVTVPVLALVLSCNLFALGELLIERPWYLSVPGCIVLFPALFTVFTAGFLGSVIYTFFPALTLTLVAIGVGPPLVPLFQGGDMPWWGRILLSLFLFAVCGGVCLSIVKLLGALVIDMYRDIAKPEGVSGVRSFWGAVRGFLVGPPRPATDALADERQLVALVRSKDGVIADRDLMALFGWNKWQAASECARIVADYGGELVIDEHGTVVYDFVRFLDTAADERTPKKKKRKKEKSTAPASTVQAAWETEPPPPRFFGCQNGLAIFVLYSAALGLLGLWLHPKLAFIPTARSYHDDAGFYEGLGGWPYFLLAIPLLRVPLWLVRRARAIRRHRALALLKRALEDDVVPHTGLDRGDRTALVSFGGELDTTAIDTPRSIFPELVRERDATALCRTQRGPVAQRQTVFVAE
jgi:hypothetical protein